MITIVLRRLGSVLLVMLVVAALSFLIFNYLGDPVNNILGVNATLEERDELRRMLGLDQPTYVQFWHFLERAVVGDFGISYRNRLPVLELILSRMPATIELVLCATVLALSVGVPMGVYCALRPKGALAHPADGLSGRNLGAAVPAGNAAYPDLLGRAALAVGLWPWRCGAVRRRSTGLLTDTGRMALIMPVPTLAIFQISMIMRLVQGEMQEVLRADFVKFARARGLPDRAVNLRHALRNSLLPVVTVVGLQIGSDRLCHRLRGGVPVAGPWPADPAGHRICRFPGNGGLSGAGRIWFRHDQPDGGHDLPLHRPEDAPQMSKTSARLRSVVDSDLAWRFRQSPAAMVAAGLLLVMVICAVAPAPLIAPHTPFDPATLNLMDSPAPGLDRRRYRDLSAWH